MKKIAIFNKVFDYANDYLETNFAFKLVPMPLVSASVNVAAKTNQARKAAVNQSAKIANSKSGPPQIFSLISTFNQE